MKLLGTNPTCTDSEPGTASIFIRGPKNKKPKNKNKIFFITFFRNNWCDQFFFLEFQLMVFVPDDSSLSSNQDTN